MKLPHKHFFRALGEWSDFAKDITSIAVKSLGTSSPTGTLVKVISGALGGGRRSGQNAINAYGTSPWLHAVVRKVCEHLAATEWKLERPRRGSKKAARDMLRMSRRYDTGSIHKALASAGAETTEVTDHPYWDVMAQPNPWMDGWDFIFCSAALLELGGDILWSVEREQAGKRRPLSIMLIPTIWVDEMPDRSKAEEQQCYRVRMPNGDTLHLPAQDTVRVRVPNPADIYGPGLGLAVVVGDEVDTDEEASKYTKSFFGNNATPSMLVGIEGAGGTAVQQGIMDRIQAQFEQRHRGSNRAHRAHFYSGKMSVHQMGAAFKDTATTDLREFQRNVFNFVWGVPPEIMGQTQSSNRATSREARALFSEENLQPRLNLLTRALQRVADMFDEGLIVSYESPVPADKEMRLESMRAAPWAASVDEWREVMDLPPKEQHGDLHMLTPGQSLLPLEPRESEPDPIRYETVPPEPEDDDASDGDGDKSAKALCGCHPQRKDAWTDLTAAQRASIDRLLTEYVEPTKFQQDLLPHYEERLAEWGQRALDEVNAGVAFNMVDQRVVRFIEELSSTRIVMINDTTRDIIRTALAEGVGSGESIPQLARRVDSIMLDPDKARATRIARTEVIGGSNFAKYAGYKQSGLVEKKQWIATESDWDNVRDEHQALHNDIVALDEPWSIDGSTTMHPGGFGVAHLDINCRCTMIAVVDDPKSLDELSGVWKAYVDTVSAWEDETTDIVARVFRDQAAALVPHLEEIP